MRVWIWIVSTCWLWNNAVVTSFSIVTTTTTTSTTASTASTGSTRTTTLLHAASRNGGHNCGDISGRRSFLDHVALMGSVVAASVIVGASPVYAAGELDDLAMPTVEPLSKDAEVRYIFACHSLRCCFQRVYKKPAPPLPPPILDSFAVTL